VKKEEKEAEKRNFWKKRGKGGKRGGVDCQQYKRKKYFKVFL